MDNTPTAEADQLDVQTRPGIMASILFADAMGVMYGSISRAASACAVAGSGKHKFSGYPRSKARCRSCGMTLFREA